MPSKKITTHPRQRRKPFSHLAFFPLLVLILIMWWIYRLIFDFPVWFDETVGKAVFFGLPVWLYVTISEFRDIEESFSLSKLKKGLLLGLAVGGIYGFVSSLLSILGGNKTVIAADLFASELFWWEFFLAIMTAFWETMFFYSWVMLVVLSKFKKWNMVKQVILVAMIFVLFHIPNTYLHFSGTAVLVQLCMLSLFAIGQSLLFVSRKNAYALILSHAIWGMVLLVHF